MATAEALAAAPGWPRRRSAVLDWLVGDARHAPDGGALLGGLCERLVAAGLPLGRASLHLRILHPQLFGLSFQWRRGDAQARITRAARGIEHTDSFLRSPMRMLIEGAAAVRQRLDLPGLALAFPLFHELRAEGLTDYVALPLTFSDGRIHGATFASDRPGGFETHHLVLIEDLLPVLSLLLEIHFSRAMAITLLDTYVGHDAGARILEGQITRGSGESVRAAIWMCDLRGFTALSEARPRDELLALLNEFFDAMAAPVERHGGAILKFIGDAMLAMFPLQTEAACRRALQAALEARTAMAELNARHAARGAPPVEYGIALHAGEVMYGNIGTRDRLDFTVIGPAVNLAARIEKLCRVLGFDIVISDTFARMCTGAAFRPLGEHRLPGVARPVEVFTVDAA